jgi:hypothetical protein
MPLRVPITTAVTDSARLLADKRVVALANRLGVARENELQALR